MGFRLYLDEDVDISLATALIHRGVDILTKQQAGSTGNSDREQLSFAKEQNRVIITHNIRDFVVLHKNFLKNYHTHCGIVLTDQLPVGTLLKRTMKLWFTLDEADMKNQIKFLSNWINNYT
jgi:predicted nuclease of predicted toxin-antitoxin system